MFWNSFWFRFYDLTCPLESFVSVEILQISGEFCSTATECAKRANCCQESDENFEFYYQIHHSQTDINISIWKKIFFLTSNFRFGIKRYHNAIFAESNYTLGAPVGPEYKIRIRICSRSEILYQVNWTSSFSSI